MLDKMAPIRIKVFLAWIDEINSKYTEETSLRKEWETWYERDLLMEEKSEIGELEDEEAEILECVDSKFEDLFAALKPGGDNDDVQQILLQKWMNCFKKGDSSDDGDTVGSFNNKVNVDLRGVGFADVELDGMYLMEDFVDMFDELAKITDEECDKDFAGHGVTNLIENLYEKWAEGMPGFDDCLKGNIPTGGEEVMKNELGVVKHYILTARKFQEWAGLCK